MLNRNLKAIYHPKKSSNFFRKEFLTGFQYTRPVSHVNRYFCSKFNDDNETLHGKNSESLRHHFMDKELTFNNYELFNVKGDVGSARNTYHHLKYYSFFWSGLGVLAIVNQYYAVCVVSM